MTNKPANKAYEEAIDVAKKSYEETVVAARKAYEKARKEESA